MRTSPRAAAPLGRGAYLIFDRPVNDSVPIRRRSGSTSHMTDSAARRHP
ncbi:unnamed protein product [[Actinomadura] parvosata subsp. kistnae]|nr:unnamed protein product [Actinomadura parvosata subsp. kistnae]